MHSESDTVQVGVLPRGGVSQPGLLVNLGGAEYAAIWRLQLSLARARHDGIVPDLLLLVEHPPTYTIGRSGTAVHLLVGPERLAEIGAQVYEVDRGGDITYHGPGQLVGYPILDLYSRGRDVHRYLRTLEEAIIRVLAGLGITAVRQPPHTGVWVGDDKVAAIGVKVSRGVALHGFALNVAPDLRYFEAIVPCGIRDKGVTSLVSLLGGSPDFDEIAARVAIELAALVGVSWQRLDLRAAPSDTLHVAIVKAAGQMVGSA